MAKVANPLPAGARRINPVFHEWSRRIGGPDALREFNRALADGRLVAWIPSRGVLPTSYWQTAQVAFDSVDPLCVIVRRGKREVRSGFYIAEAALPAAGDAIAAVAVKEAGDMGRRGDIAKGRQDSVAAFRRQAGGAGFETSLRAVGEHQPRDGRAISNWFLQEPIRQPVCFCCRALFTPARRPGGFLTAVPIKAPKAGIAVAGICAQCWSEKTPQEIENAALALMRRNLGTRGGFAD